MNWCSLNKSRLPVAGVLAVGLLACTAGLFGSPPNDSARQQRVEGWQGYPVINQIPKAPPVMAFRLDTVLSREGQGSLDVSYGTATRTRLWDGDPLTALATVTCRKNVDCDDCNPCTTDVCNVPQTPGVIEGFCTNATLGLCNSCTNGDFCDGQEICDDLGVCRDAVPADGCAGQAPKVCDPLGGDQNKGACVDACAIDADCNDGLFCTGVEICVGGLCRSQGFPCGTFSTQGCDEGGQTCSLFGRCCNDNGSGDFLTCSRTTKDACTGRWLEIGDDPDVPLDQGDCDVPAPETGTFPGEDFGCPGYSAGVVPSNVTGEVGKFGVAACNAVQEVGDDYTIAGCDAGAGDFYEITTVRVVRSFQTDGIPGSVSRILVSFYDATGNFIEDTITNPVSGGDLRLNTFVFDEKPRVPCTGFVVFATAGKFSPFGKGTVGVAGAIDTGSNDLDLFWKNGAIIDATSPAEADIPALGARALAFELVGSVASSPLGACCNSANGSCTRELPWICQKNGDFAQGIGSFCQVCANNDAQPCTTAADCPACVGGNNPGVTCDVNTDCPGGGVCTNLLCVGGDTPNVACSPDSDCDTGVCTAGSAACNAEPQSCGAQACCDNANGACIEVLPGNSCPIGTTGLGFGTNCTPNCCTQPPGNVGEGGYDTCVEAALPANLITIPVPIPGDPPFVATISGNSLNASYNDNNVGVDPTFNTCQLGIFSPAGGQDRGWWHAFTTDSCANIRIDFCCTEERAGEPKKPQWANLWDTCNPCVTTVATSIVGNGVGTTTASGDRGSPFCAGDDLWGTYGPLPGGVYWVPVLSTPNGSFGDYQLHITAEACPVAACCIDAQDAVTTGVCLTAAQDGKIAGIVDGVGTATPCTLDSDCVTAGAGVSCGNCALVNELDCDAVTGFYNGFGNIPLTTNPTVSCIGGICDSGSCCTGPGTCIDVVQGQPLTKPDCDSANGVFVGGSLCDNPIVPCPACTAIGESNCQLPPNGLMYMSDLSAFGENGIVSADDVVLEASTLDTVCVWGVYLDPTDPGTGNWSCIGDGIPDRFRVRIMADLNGLPDGGTVLGESEVTGGNVGRGPEQGLFFTGFGNPAWPEVQGYTLTLDTPLAGLPTGVRVWLEVANATFVEPSVTSNTCNWHWAQHIPDLASAGPAYCASGISPGSNPGVVNGLLEGVSSYVDGSARGGVDLAFCLGSGGAPANITVPDPPLGCCFDCDGVTTTASSTLLDCTEAGGAWSREDEFCLGLIPALPNDTCQGPLASTGVIAASGLCGNSVVDAGEQCDDGNLVDLDGCDSSCLLECTPAAVPPGDGALIVPPNGGLFKWETACATNDGPLVVDTDIGDIALGGDIWYLYTANCTGSLNANLCATQTGFNQNGFGAGTNVDSAIGLYHDFSNPTVAPCPGITLGVSPLQVAGANGGAGDESCDGISDAGAGAVSQITFPGEQWLVRVGGFLTVGSPIDQASRGRGIVSISCTAVECFPSATPTAAQVLNAAAAGLTDARNARVIGVLGSSADAGHKQAMRVTAVSLPSPFEVWNGQSMFVQVPSAFSELPGRGLGAVPPVLGGEDTFLSARLACNKFETDWTQFGTEPIWIRGEMIVPSRIQAGGGGLSSVAMYDVSLIDSTCDSNNLANFSVPLPMSTAGWGDIGSLTGGIEVAADDTVGSFDFLFILQKFAGLGGTPGSGGTPIKVRVDMLGFGTGPEPDLDGVIGAAEIVVEVDSFGGAIYPFAPSSSTLCP